MKLLATSDAFNAEFRRLSQQYRFFDWAVAWASAGHAAFKGLLQYRTKIRRIVVGTHFHQTAPAFIDAFTDVPAVRYRLDQAGVNGVFHPKLYLFSNDETDWETVIGSANFTAGAFTRNVEHAIVLSSKDAVEGCGYSDLIAEVARLWEGGRAFTSGELDAYRLRWDHNRKLLDRVAGHDAGQKRRKSVYDQDLMTYSWVEYLQALQERREKYFAQRLDIAPQPLLMQLGYLLSELPTVDVYQRRREPQTWQWADVAPEVAYRIDEPAVERRGPVAAVFSLSATVNESRITTVLGDQAAVWKFSIAQPDQDFLRTWEHLSAFRRAARQFLDRIKARHGQSAVLHVFPAMPVSAAVEFGRIIQPKADVAMQLYDQQQPHGFVPALTLNKHSADQALRATAA